MSTWSCCQRQPKLNYIMTIPKEGNNDIEDSKQDAYFRFLKSNCFNSLYIHIIANDTYQHSLVFDKVLTNHNSSFRV